MGKSSFLRHAAVYGAGNLLVYAGGFLLLPLYVRCLNESEYGTLDVLNRLGEVVLLCLLYNGLRQALIAFHNQATDDRERRAVVGSALTLAAVLLGAGGGLVFLSAEPLSRWLKTDPALLRLAVVAVVLESLYLLFLALAQARQESLFFVLISVGQFLTRASLALFLVLGLQRGIDGVLLAGAVASGAFVLALSARELCRGSLCIDRGQLRAMAWFALPFVPAGVGLFLLNSGDRFFLVRHVSPAEVGAYALGYKLAMVVKEFSRQPLYMVWSARMYEAARRPDAAMLFGQVFTRVLGVYTAVGLGLCLVQEEVILFLTGHDYGGAARVIAPVVLAYLFVTAADLMDAAFYVRRQTAWKTPVMLASTVVVLALYALLIPPYGKYGAALATLFGFLFHAILTGIVAQRVFPVRYEWVRLAALLTTATGIWLVSLLLPVSWWLLPVKAALWLAWPLLLWLTGVFSEEEKEWARAFFRKPLVEKCESEPVNALASSS
jgi:O-antigen/teichoic acid export membrane protein